MNWGLESGVAESRELGGRVGEGGVHLVAQHDYATAIDLLVPIVETSCSPRCQIQRRPSPPSLSLSLSLFSRLSNSVPNTWRVFGKKEREREKGARWCGSRRQMREKER